MVKLSSKCARASPSFFFCAEYASDFHSFRLSVFPEEEKFFRVIQKDNFSRKTFARYPGRSSTSGLDA